MSWRSGCSITAANCSSGHGLRDRELKPCGKGAATVAAPREIGRGVSEGRHGCDPAIEIPAKARCGKTAQGRGQTFKAKPCVVMPWEIRTPIDANLEAVVADPDPRQTFVDER